MAKKELKVDATDFYSMVAEMTAEPDALPGQMNVGDFPGVDPSQDEGADAVNEKGGSDAAPGLLEAVLSAETLSQEERKDVLKMLVKKERKTYTDEELADLKEKYLTQGRKGAKLPRVNVAFAPDLWEYVRAMARTSGMTYSGFVEQIVKEHKDAHAEEYARIMELRKVITIGNDKE